MGLPSGTISRSRSAFGLRSMKPAARTRMPRLLPLHEYEIKIVALERMVGRQALEIEFSRGR